MVWTIADKTDRGKSQALDSKINHTSRNIVLEFHIICK